MLILLGLLTACQPQSQLPTVARIEVSPAAVLLRPGEQVVLTAVAHGADGEVLPLADVRFVTNDPDATVDRHGKVTGGDHVASAQVFAEVDGVRSAPVLVTIAEPVAGALLVPDDAIVDVALPDPDGIVGVGFPLEVTLRDTDVPTVGQIVLGTGAYTVSGRVEGVTTDGDDAIVSLRMVPFTELFDAVVFDEVIDLEAFDRVLDEALLDAYDVVARADGALEFVGRPELRAAGAVGTSAWLLECTTSGSAPVVQLLAPSFTVKTDLDLVVDLHDGALHRLTVGGTVEAEAKVAPTAQVAFEGKVSCKRQLWQVPLPGSVAGVLGPSLKVGAGFEVGGRATVAKVGVELVAKAKASGEVGVDCSGECAMVNEWSATATGDAKLVPPDMDTQMRVEPKVFAFGYADPSFGLNLPFVSGLGLSPFSVKIGLQQKANLATPEAQVADGAYASDYALETVLAASVEDTALQSLLGLFTISVAKLELKVESQLSRSPLAEVALAEATQANVPVDGTITFEPAEVSYLGLYNLAEVHVVRVVGDTLETVETLSATDGQTTFAFQWIPTADEVADPPEFAVLMTTVLLPWLDLEVEKDSRRPVATPHVRLVRAVGSWQVTVDSSDTDIETEQVMGSSANLQLNVVADGGGFQASATATSQGTSSVSLQDDWLLGASFSGSTQTMATNDGSGLTASAECWASMDWYVDFEVVEKPAVVHLVGGGSECFLYLDGVEIQPGDFELDPWEAPHHITLNCGGYSGFQGGSSSSSSYGITATFQ